MLTNLSWKWSSEMVPRLPFWASDRSEDQVEGEHLLDTGNFIQAEIRLAQAIFNAEKQRHSARRRIQLRLELAASQRGQFSQTGELAKLDAAESTIREALELAEHTRERHGAFECLDILSVLLAEAGKHEALEQVVEDANRMELTLPKADPILKARRLSRLGLARRKSGRVSDAIPALEETVQLFEKLEGPDHLDTATQLTELGDCYRFLGQQAKAQKVLLRAIRIHERECGLDSQEAVHDLNLLTNSYEAAGDLESAAAQQERVLGLKERAVGASLDEIAEAQIALAVLYRKWNMPLRARELLMEAIGTFKRTKGARLAVAYESLASIEEGCGHFQSALTELANAGKVWETVQDEHTPELVRNLEYRAELMTRMRMAKDAEYLRRQAAVLSQAFRWAHAV